MSPAVEVENLELAPGDEPILNGVSFAVGAGEAVVVRGASGSGKSSLLLALVGALPPRRGHIRIAGMPLDADHAAAIRRRVFYMPQEVRAFERETGREFIQRALDLAVNRGRRRTPGCTAELCAALSLDEALLDAPLASLSGGERQRLGLLRGSGLSLRLFFVTYPALLLAVGLVLAYFMLLVFAPDPVLDARYVIPVAGMLLGNSMNRAIITLERFYSDIRADQAGYVSLVAMGATLREATAPYLATAYRAGLAPSLANTANIGLVFLPGMMTGQILGGSEPMTAIEYQIAIILAIFVTTELASLLAIRFSMIRGFDDLGFLDPSVFR